MRYGASAICGVVRVELEPHFDERGYFARTFCSQEFADQGLPLAFEQSSLSRNVRAGTLRGLHYQAPPWGEAKLVRCVRGAIFDVALDVRPDSATFGQWVGEALSAENGVALYIPPGVAHGFQTLEDNSDILYQISPAYRAGHEKGIRWNDPAFSVCWPLTDPLISPRDASFSDWAGVQP